jgi:hypothetical protein
MSYDEIIEKVSMENNLPKKLVDRTYRAYWRAIREHITALPLKEDLSDEEFLKLQPNVNIASIGKLNVTLDRYKRMKKMQKIRKELRDAAHKKD